jgi:hypothetical protein
MEPEAGIKLNAELNLDKSYLIEILFKIGQIDPTKCTEPLKVSAM